MVYQPVCIASTSVCGTIRITSVLFFIGFTQPKISPFDLGITQSFSGEHKSSRANWNSDRRINLICLESRCKLKQIEILSSFAYLSPARISSPNWTESFSAGATVNNFQWQQKPEANFLIVHSRSAFWNLLIPELHILTVCHEIWSNGDGLLPLIVGELVQRVISR